MEQRQPIHEPIIIPPSKAAQYLAQRDIEVDLLRKVYRSVLKRPGFRSAY